MLSSDSGVIKDLVFAPDGSAIYSASSGGEVRRWEVETGLAAPNHPIIVHEREVGTLALSPDGRTLVSGSMDHTLLQDAVLFTKVLDHRILLATDPAGQGGDKDLPRLQSDGHPKIAAR